MDASRRWLHSPSFDLTWFAGAPLLAAIAVLLVPALRAPETPLWGWVVFVVFIDVGHVYASLYRTYLDPEEFQRRRGLYVGVPAACWAIGALLYGLSAMTFWRTLAYLAVFHFVRQQYGFMRAYSRFEGRKARWKDDWRLFLNGNLQFSTMDEYRYHEALVHPAMSAHRAPRDVLILGGGDGLAAREILRDPRVERVTLVDLDPEMTRLFSQHEILSRLNSHSLTDPRVRVINADAFRWLEENDRGFDVAIVDFPDPSNYAVGKLFTTAFYRLLRRRLNTGGIVSVQATSPLFARTTYWTVVATMEAGGFKAFPYHAYVPSFGEWGFVIGATAPYRVPDRFPPNLRYLTPDIARGMFDFPADMSRVPAEANRLDTQILVQNYEREWARINHGG
jgi:spermidine synthase